MIVAVRAESAMGHEADSLPVIIDRARWLRHKVAEIVADAGYASAGTYQMLERGGDHRVHPAAAEHAPHRPRPRGPRTLQIAERGWCRGRPDHARRGRDREMKRHGAGRARCRGTREGADPAAARRDRDQPQTTDQPAAGRRERRRRRRTRRKPPRSTPSTPRTPLTGPRSPRTSRSSRPASAPSTPSTPPTQPLLRQAPRPLRHAGCTGCSLRGVELMTPTRNGPPGP